MENLQDGYLLRNGIKIPCIGFGTWKSPDDVVCESVKVAIEAGYRHIDGAAAYANEAGVGKGIRESGIPREELFITSKLPNADHGYGPAKESFERTLNQMGLEYLDLYLIHWPVALSIRMILSRIYWTPGEHLKSSMRPGRSKPSVSATL